MNSLLIKNAGTSPLFNAQGSQSLSVRCARGKIEEVGADLPTRKGETVLDAQHGALIPGLHDHHIHLLATAAAQLSIDCAGLNEAQFLSELKRAELKKAELKRAELKPTDKEIRVVNYHESIAGPLDRQRLDGWVTNQPLRVQHSTGQMWFLNSRALAEYGLEHHASEAIERNPDGTPNGRLFRGDDLLKQKSGKKLTPSLHELSLELSSYGITGVTDTSHNNTDEEFALLRAKQNSGELLQHLRVMGRGELTEVRQSPGQKDDYLAPNINSGELKILLDEAALPDLDELIETVNVCHQENRGVAVHCVTQIELAIVLGVFGAAGKNPSPHNPQDRIEHASLLPASALSQVQALGLTAVTQPGLIYSRGDRYLSELSAQELTQLYRLQSLQQQGIPLALSSDAPYGPLNPWLNMQCSVDRKTASGALINANEGLTPEQALHAYCGSAEQPALPRTITPGALADLAVLSKPWSEVRLNLAQTKVRTTIRAGQLLPGSYAQEH